MKYVPSQHDEKKAWLSQYRLRGPTFSKDVFYTIITNDGCELSEHHRDTVASFLSNCSPSHLPERFWSTKTAFNLFMRSISVNTSFADMLKSFDVIYKFSENFSIDQILLLNQHGSFI